MTTRDQQKFRFEIDDGFRTEPDDGNHYMMDADLILKVSAANVGIIPGVLHASQPAHDDGVPDVAVMSIVFTNIGGEVETQLICREDAFSLGVELLAWSGRVNEREKVGDGT